MGEHKVGKAPRKLGAFLSYIYKVSNSTLHDENLFFAQKK